MCPMWLFSKSYRTLCEVRHFPLALDPSLLDFTPRLYSRAFASTSQVHYILLVVIRTRA